MIEINTRMRTVASVVLFAVAPVAWAQGGRYVSDESWTFGVTADTQWTITHSLEWDPIDPYYAHVNPNYREENPNYVSVATLQRVNEEFIAHDVSFVVQLGDLTDRAGNAAMQTHADARQPLYDAGIGFFPVRGNHETYGDLYGLDPDADMNVPAWREAFPQTQGLGPNVFDARSFNGPDEEALRGLSYSFDYGANGSDARFVFVDIEPTSYNLVEPVPHPDYGLGSQYLGWVIYQHDMDVLAGNGSVITPGTWFRIDSSGNPSTNYYGFEETFPIADWASPQEPELSSDGTDYRPGDQQDWISARLTDDERPEHAFVLTHRNLMGQNHVDTTWGSDPGVDPEAQNLFYRSLEENGVGYFLSAHDHMHHRSIVTSPDGNWSVEQLIASSSDPKFYTPAAGSLNGQRSRETPISQELSNIGYYIFNVDGARVTVDYYSDRTGEFGTDYCWPDGYAGPEGSCGDPRFGAGPERIGSLYLPNFYFEKKETWGYGTNGQRFIVPQGVSYAGETIADGEDLVTHPQVSDSFRGTHAAILHGFNGSTATDNIPDTPRALSKTVTTGWMSTPDRYWHTLKSDILSLWGMAELGTEETDEYVLSMSFDVIIPIGLGNGSVGIATFVDGKWVNAVDENFGGSKKFVLGTFDPSKHELGTYGIDLRSKTAWAVLNYNADFAVAGRIDRPGGGQGGSDRPRPGRDEVADAVRDLVTTLIRILRSWF